MSEWISVQDRLPEDDRNIIIASSHYADGTGPGYFLDDEWYMNGCVLPIPSEEVTHWMDYPESPIGYQ